METTSARSNLIISLPNEALASATLLIEFVASSSSGEVDDMGFRAISINSCSPDTDGDGKINSLDLDSDGDGCSDAIEAGSSETATSTSVFPTGTDSNNNGLLNDYESTTTAGAINYSSTYSLFALNNTINVCTDTDGDGIRDLFDLDDDNDGVLDDVEYASCFAEPTITMQNINGTTTGVLGYNSSFPTWMKFSFDEREAGYKLIFSKPVSDIVFEFASIYNLGEQIGNFTVKMSDGTIYSGLDFDLSTSHPFTDAIWTPQPDGVDNFRDTDNDGCSDANEAYGVVSAQGTDGNMYYGAGNPPAVKTDGTVTAATYPGTNANVSSAGSASSISTQPIDNSLAEGVTTTTFSAVTTAGSGTTSYQWQQSTDNGTNWTNVLDDSMYSGSTTLTLTLTGVTSSMNGYTYRLNIAQSDFQCCSFILASPPSIIDDNLTSTEDLPLSGNVLTNDSGSGSPAVTFTVSGYSIAGLTGPFTIGTVETIPSIGTILVNSDGTFTFTPVMNYNGTVPVITYTVSDENGGMDSGDLTITVTSVNDMPVAVDDVVTTPEDSPVSGNVLTNDTDVEGNTLTVSGYSIVGITGPFTIGTPATIPSIGTIILNADGTFTFTPVANYNGTVPVITYTVSDGNGGTDMGDLAITVTAVNDAPVAVDDVVTTPEDSPVSGNVLTNDTDVEGNTLTVSGYSIAGSTGPFTIGTPATIPMDDVVTTPEDSPVSGNVLTNDTDVEGNTLTVSGYSIAGITGPFTIGTTETITTIGIIVVNADGSFTFTPEANYKSTVPVITYTVSDGNGGTDTGDLTITVTSVNDVPVALDDVVTTPEDSPVSGNVLTNDTDADGNTLIVSGYSIVGITGSFIIGTTETIPSIGTIVVNGDGSFTFTPEANYNGTVPVITYTVSDGNGGTDTGDLTITVTAVNDAPVAVDDIISSSGDSPVLGNVLTNDTDADGNTLTVSGYSIAGSTGPFTIETPATIPSVGTIIVNADGSFTFTPVENYNGTVPVITYTLSDGNGGTDTGDLTITVTAVNDAPVAVDDIISSSGDSPVLGNVLTNDTDADEIL
ncbi:hypothetical protein GHT06_003736 [Daphnia sinensis]|uniref:Tandem-95 repeat protein n=1 Tax=Daphnia sinensis TaxID=1820382 RepID=A0AAD5KSI7_9CRUS|nr:hypothetical protein GHT06_003736 [Daphnia sinensis]